MAHNIGVVVDHHTYDFRRLKKMLLHSEGRYLQKRNRRIYRKRARSYDDECINNLILFLKEVASQPDLIVEVNEMGIPDDLCETCNNHEPTLPTHCELREFPHNGYSVVDDLSMRKFEIISGQKLTMGEILELNSRGM